MEVLTTYQLIMPARYKEKLFHPLQAEKEPSEDECMRPVILQHSK